jgi:hypothetical protein
MRGAPERIVYPMLQPTRPPLALTNFLRLRQRS